MIVTRNRITIETQLGLKTSMELRTHLQSLSRCRNQSNNLRIACKQHVGASSTEGREAAPIEGLVSQFRFGAGKIRDKITNMFGKDTQKVGRFSAEILRSERCKRINLKIL